MNPIPNSFKHSVSPLVPKLKQVLKIRQISASPLNDHEDSRIQLKLSESQSKFSKIFPKITKKKVSSSLNYSVSQESSESHPNLDIDSENLKIEQILRKKLRKESNLVKKFEVVLNTFEKLSRLGRNFYIFHSVLKEFFNQFKNFLVFTEDKEALVKDLELKAEELNRNNERLEEDLKKYAAEVKNLKEELEKTRTENKSLRPKVKKQSLLLNKLKDQGFPVEKMYESMVKPSTKSRSMNKINFLMNDEEKRPSSIPSKGIVPKLKFTHLEGNEGKDGKKLTTDLLHLTFLPRSPLIDKRINEAVAYRHLLRNNVIKSVPALKKHSDLLFDSVFDEVYLDIRPEDPSESGRIAISVKSTSLSSVIKHFIVRKTRYLTRNFLPPHSLTHDLIIFPKPAVYFANDDQILKDLQKISYFCNNSSDPRLKSDFSLSEEENLYKILKFSYSSKPDVFFRNFRKIESGLVDPNSCISVKARQQVLKKSKGQVNMSPLRIQLKKWCRDEGIFENFYRFISKSYPAILSYESLLPFLPRYVNKAIQDESKDSNFQL